MKKSQNKRKDPRRKMGTQNTREERKQAQRKRIKQNPQDRTMNDPGRTRRLVKTSEYGPRKLVTILPARERPHTTESGLSTRRSSHPEDIRSGT